MAFETAVDNEIPISAGEVILRGDLAVPEGATGIVLFAHGSGSGRTSPRNRFVAQRLNTAGIATLLFDLLTEREEAVDLVTAGLRFDIGLLATRLSQTADWVAQHDPVRGLPRGYFGASTGAAAALVSAANRTDIGAVVSRGGRPDLAAGALEQVKAPVLLIVGGEDYVVLDLNRTALQEMKNAPVRHIEIVERATHLFEEPGALEQVSRLAAQWFARYLPNPKS